LALSLNRYGAILSELGYKKEARGYLDQGLEMRRKMLAHEKNTTNQRALAISLSYVADFLADIGDGPTALRYFEESVQLYSEVYPKDRFPVGHPELASSLQNLAFVHSNLYQYEAAAENGQRAADMNKALAAAKIPVDRQGWATSLANLGEIYYHLKKYAEASQCLLESLTLYR
jgi:tetratricopeptide (TPR) repeat protein